MSRLHRQLMRVLIADIACGSLALGDKLPREADLAAQFSVSRGVAREAIRGLEERGLVDVKHGRGATVNPEERWDGDSAADVTRAAVALLDRLASTPGRPFFLWVHYLDPHWR